MTPFEVVDMDYIYSNDRFLTGFVLLFPWLLCGFFIRSKQEVPRYMGILSIMLFPATLMLIGFYLRTWKVVV